MLDQQESFGASNVLNDISIQFSLNSASPEPSFNQIENQPSEKHSKDDLIDEPYNDNEMVPEQVPSKSEKQYSSEWSKSIQKLKKINLETKKKYRKKCVYLDPVKLLQLKRLFKEHLQDVNNGIKKMSDLQKIASMLDVSVSTIYKKFSQFKLEAKNTKKQTRKKEIKFQEIQLRRSQRQSKIISKIKQQEQHNQIDQILENNQTEQKCSKTKHIKKECHKKQLNFQDIIQLNSIFYKFEKKKTQYELDYNSIGEHFSVQPQTIYQKYQQYKFFGNLIVQKHKQSEPCQINKDSIEPFLNQQIQKKPQQLNEASHPFVNSSQIAVDTMNSTILFQSNTENKIPSFLQKSFQPLDININTQNKASTQYESDPNDNYSMLLLKKQSDMIKILKAELYQKQSRSFQQFAHYINQKYNKTYNKHTLQYYYRKIVNPSNQFYDKQTFKKRISFCIEMQLLNQQQNAHIFYIDTMTCYLKSSLNVKSDDQLNCVSIMIAASKNGILTYEFKFGLLNRQDLYSFIDSCAYEIRHHKDLSNSKIVFLTNNFNRSLADKNEQFNIFKSKRFQKYGIYHKEIPSKCPDLNPLTGIMKFKKIITKTMVQKNMSLFNLKKEMLQYIKQVNQQGVKFEFETVEKAMKLVYKAQINERKKDHQ